MSEAKVLPCPWCGTAPLERPVETFQGAVYVACPECDAIGPSDFTIESAIAAWNQRTPDATLAESLALLREAREHLIAVQRFEIRDDLYRRIDAFEARIAARGGK